MQYRFMRFPEGKGKAFTLSYDDGNKNDIRLSDIIYEYGIKCTFNLTSMNRIALTAEQVREYILNRGHEVAVHGAMHMPEGKIRPIEGIKDVFDSRTSLESEFGIIVRGMAYPSSGIRFMLPGNSYENIREYLKNLDIAYARTLGGDNNFFRLPEDWFAWMPTAHHDNPKLMEYLEEFINIDLTQGYYANRHSRLFYMWGHSYEFADNNNWQHLEEICKKVSDREDVWFATNMEIYDYVNAYNSLMFSADGKIIKNPTLTDIWFEQDEKLYKLESGQTLYI